MNVQARLALKLGSLFVHAAIAERGAIERILQPDKLLLIGSTFCQLSSRGGELSRSLGAFHAGRSMKCVTSSVERPSGAHNSVSFGVGLPLVGAIELDRTDRLIKRISQAYLEGFREMASRGCVTTVWSSEVDEPAMFLIRVDVV